MNIHRCRFVPYPPSTINALAFSHPSTNSHKGGLPPTLRLAVGRANGDIDIWNPLKGSWFHETTLKGGKDRSIEGLVWTQEPDDEDDNGGKIDGKLRLFSIGYSSAVTEWDLGLGKPVRHTSGNYGEIWCIAAQPKWQAIARDKQPAVEGGFHGQNIVIGCADGAVVLLSTADGDLKFQRSLSRASAKKARILSVTFQNRFIVIAGCADSTIRVFDTRSGQILRSMSLGSGPTGGPKEILVWSVKCLSNGSIVSGDSTGEVRFWDGKNYTLTQRLKSHQADVLDIETSIDGDTVISGGMDRRSIVYKRIGTGKGQDRRRWAKVMHRRFHSHDVKTMATFEAKNFSVIASGGDWPENTTVIYGVLIFP
jgi:U3 small nucleolar RNA-associated protein 4